MSKLEARVSHKSDHKKIYRHSLEEMAKFGLPIEQIQSEILNFQMKKKKIRNKVDATFFDETKSILTRCLKSAVLEEIENDVSKSQEVDEV